MKLKSFLLILMLSIVIIPLNINAKTIYAGSTSYGNIESVILEPGDIIDFSNSSTPREIQKFYIYLDDELVTPDCFGVEDVCHKQFVVENRMIVHKNIYINSSQYGIHFYSLKPDDTLIEIDLSPELIAGNVEERFYKSGNIIKINNIYTNLLSNVYEVNDFDGNRIESVDMANFNPGIIILPQINGKDVYWGTSVEIIIYDIAVLSFTPIDYTEPNFELICNKDRINYGEKANCELNLECRHIISEIDFTMSQKDLKFSNLKYSKNITNSGNDQSIKLEINDENICNEKKTIMTFDVEATKEDTYLDSIQLRDIVYKDEVLTGSYNNLDSNLNIVSNKNTIINPSTGTKFLFIIIPIILLILVGTTYTLKTKKKTT